MNFLRMIGLFLIVCCLLEGHEGHHVSVSSIDPNLLDNSLFSSSLMNSLNRIGRFHLIFLHFPIALILMTVVAELLWIWFKNPIFDHAARFMIVAAAIFVVPTALLGLSYGYAQVYEGVSADLYFWHRFFGITTTFLAILAAILRERYVRQYTTSLLGYYVCLLILFFSVSLTGAFGGSLAFGLDVW